MGNHGKTETDTVSAIGSGSVSPVSWHCHGAQPGALMRFLQRRSSGADGVRSLTRWMRSSAHGKVRQDMAGLQDCIVFAMITICNIYIWSRVPCSHPPHGMGGVWCPCGGVYTYIHTYIHTYIPTYIHTSITLPYLTLPYLTFHTYIHTHYIPLHTITLPYITLPYITLPYIPYIHT